MPQPKPTIRALDHLVLTVADIPATVTFYERCLNMQATEFRTADGETRWALKFGRLKINLHQAGQEFEPKALHPTPGSADLCLLSDMPLADWVAHLTAQGVAIEEGPVARTGAMHPLISIYLRDPDQNLIEIAVEQAPPLT